MDYIHFSFRFLLKIQCHFERERQHFCFVIKILLQNALQNAILIFPKPQKFQAYRKPKMKIWYKASYNSCKHKKIMATDSKRMQNMVARKPPLAHFHGAYLNQVLPLYPNAALKLSHQALCTEAPLRYHILKWQDNLINTITMLTNYQLNLEWIISSAKKFEDRLKLHCSKKKGEIYYIFPHAAF